LLKVAVDEGAKYAEELYRAGLDYYKAVISFYSDPLAASQDEATVRRKVKAKRRLPVRGRGPVAKKGQRPARARSGA